MKKFLRRDWRRYSKLGKGRKKLQVWRKPKGRDNKMREKRIGYPVIVKIGYSTYKKQRGKIEGKNLIKIFNLEDLKKIKKNEMGIIGSVGKKKKIEIAKKAEEMKIELYNLNPKQFLKKTKKEIKK